MTSRLPRPACDAEQKLLPQSELRLIHTPDGHLSLFGTDPEYIGQVDRHLRGLLSIAVWRPYDRATMGRKLAGFAPEAEEAQPSLG